MQALFLNFLCVSPNFLIGWPQKKGNEHPMPDPIVPKGVAHVAVDVVETPDPIVFALQPNLSMLAFTSAVETLRIANQLTGQILYTWTTMSETGENVRCSNGIEIGHRRPIGGHPNQRLCLCLFRRRARTRGNPQGGRLDSPSMAHRSPCWRPLHRRVYSGQGRHSRRQRLHSALGEHHALPGSSTPHWTRWSSSTPSMTVS